MIARTCSAFHVSWNSLTSLPQFERTIAGVPIQVVYTVMSEDENVFDVVVVEVVEDDWDLAKVMTASWTNRSGLPGKFYELQNECQTVHTEVPAGLVNVVRMANLRMSKRGLTLED